MRAHHLIPALFAGALLAGASATAAELTADVGLDSVGTTNVFLDASQERDLILRPRATLGVDFGEYWSAGYGGELSLFTQHPDLLSQWHEAFVFANPAWGKEGENEYTVELRAQWLSNRNAWATLDFLDASLLNKLILEPSSWLRWQGEVEAGVRHFYNDTSSSSFDLKAATSLSLTLPTRTTLTPRVGFGMRRYFTPVVLDAAAPADPADYQLEVGAHASQALWPRAGLQLDYAYRPAIGRNALLESKLRQERFAYFGEDFLYSGQAAKVGLKQLLGEHWAIEGSLSYEVREFGGWPAMDETGALTGEERRDTRWMPRLAVRYGWASTREDPLLQRAGISLEYGYLDQRSTNAWYDTSAHQTALTVWGSW